MRFLVQHEPAIWLVLAVLTIVTQGHAAICPVPSPSHPTIQSAVDDLDCSEVVLAAQSFVESPVIGRDLVLQGASSSTTVIVGQLQVHGGSCEIRQLTIDASLEAVGGGHWQALYVHSGAQVSCNDVVAVNSSSLFADGFESGDTSNWSVTLP